MKTSMKAGQTIGINVNPIRPVLNQCYYKIEAVDVMRNNNSHIF